MRSEVSVQGADFDVGAEIGALSAGRPDVGAVASFVGLVRDVNDGSGVQAMTLEHYPSSDQRALACATMSASARSDDSPLRPAGADRSHCFCRCGQQSSW